MKNILSIIAFCFIASVSFAQKFSYEYLYVSPNPNIQTHQMYSQSIIYGDSYHKYLATVTLDIAKNKVIGVLLKDMEKNTVIALNKVTYIKNFYPSTIGYPNSWGSLGEAYAFKGTGTNLTLYFMAGMTVKASPNETKFEFMFYAPKGPQEIAMGN